MDEPVSVQAEPETQAEPAAIEAVVATESLPEAVADTAVLSDPHLDLLKQALGKLDSIRH